MKRSFAKAIALVLSVIGFSGVALADIWQECDYLLTGARDKNGNGVVDDGELINQMSGATGEGVNVKKGTGRLVYTNLNVSTYSAYTNSNPDYAGWTATNRTCVYADQLTGANCSMDSGFNPGVSNYTFICRVRRDGIAAENGHSYLLSTFTEKAGTSSAGFWFGPCTKGKYDITEGGVNTGNQIQLYFGTSDYNFSSAVPFRNGRWVNLVMTVSNLVVTVGVKDETMKDIAWASHDFSNDSKVTGTAKSSMPIENLCFLGTKYGDKNSFHGAMQFAAVWKRPLSQAEIVEAFSDRHPAIWRVGVEGKGEKIFGGASGQGETELPLSLPDWSRMPSAFAAGDSVKIPFDVQREEDGLSQYVRLKGRSGSGVFRVSVDGIAYGEETVSAGQIAHFFVPKGVLTKTCTHICTIARVDQGASGVCLDFYDMLGSFRVGLEDLSTTGTGVDGTKFVVDYPLCNANLYAIKTHLTPVSTNVTGGVLVEGFDKFAYIVDLPSDIVNRSKFTYTTRWYDANNVAGQRMLLKVNGTKTYETVVKSGSMELAYKFRPGDLLPGKNRFEWSLPDLVPGYKADGTTRINYWYRCDYQRLEANPYSGLILVVR